MVVKYLYLKGNPRLLGEKASVKDVCDRPEVALYEFDLADPIPSFPVPLQPQDAPPTVNLQQLLHDIYTRARFDLVIDYSQPLQPPLSREAAAWAQRCLDS
jgi:hypothetical protein